VLSRVEEVLGNPEIEDFVKSFREGSKATITRIGENKYGLFLEVDVGGRRGCILFPEGWDGRGWSRVSGELWLFWEPWLGLRLQAVFHPLVVLDRELSWGKEQDVYRLRRW
jgi:hypothetical protein